MSDKNIFKKDFTSVFAVVDIDNIDTDMLIPKQFLKTTSRTGLGKYLFYEKRYLENDKINDNFILNCPPFNKAQILVAGKNFGCGSSREHAPWALKDFGIKVIIAESFADIFYNNCFENLILPIILKNDEIAYIKHFFKNGNENNNIANWNKNDLQKETSNIIKMTINLKKQIIECGDRTFNFNIDLSKKTKILNQIDTIDEILKKIKLVENFEKNNNI